ncbi:MAG: acyl-CoA synthetase [Calditrichaeota bacterium]|nr:acyl-CoA synthetase [Calditrichota bacterium]
MIIRNLRDIEAIEKTPIEKNITAKNTYEMILQGARGSETKTALTFFLTGKDYEKPTHITYQQLVGRIHQTANMLRDFGIGPNDVVTILLPNIPHTHFVIWGGEAAGIINPINPMLEAPAIKNIMNAAKTKVLVALGPVPGTDIWQKVESIRKDIPTLKTIIQVMGPGDEANGIYNYDAIIDKYNPMKLDSGRQIGPDDIAAYFHTGGTTGTPKLAKHTHFMEVHDAWAITIVADATPHDVFMCGLPLFHVNGVIITGLAPFSKGATVLLPSAAGYRDTDFMMNFFKIVEKYKVTFFSAVPTVYSALLQIPMGEADVSSLKYAICGAAPMPVETFTAFEKKTGIKILEGYGLTEGTCASSVNPKDGERRVGSIGIRFPYQPMKTVILDENGQYVRDCQPDEQGIIVIKGPNVFPGYVQEEHNQGIWVQPGWFNTGDIGREDKDGYFWITGRAKDLIIRGGHNIDPAMIEEPLYRHPAVALAAAVGKPDAYAGEVPVLYVTLKKGAQATEEEILAYAKEQIVERAAIPKQVFILPEIPVTPVGKIFKPALRWDAARRAFEEALADLKNTVASLKIEVGPHPIHGTIAKITVSGDQQEAVEQQIHDLLKDFTIRYDIVWE